jgi:hypothetical protein
MVPIFLSSTLCPIECESVTFSCMYLMLNFFACRDDPELDNMLKERIRWGDPMAHLVKVTALLQHLIWSGLVQSVNT